METEDRGGARGVEGLSVNYVLEEYGVTTEQSEVEGRRFWVKPREGGAKAELVSRLADVE